ncbi:MAG: IS91 family transposase [Phycisphaerae bacterium]|nr:IS91 family transposase [Phycisphaerae bacterium]
MDCHLGSGSPGEGGPKLRVVDMVRRHADAWRANHVPSPEQARVLRDVERCRTAALGGHLHHCAECGYEVPVYNACHNRHCPNCQAIEQARWIEAREAVLLPVGHHHVVFTLPAQLRPLARRFPREIYNLLFRAVRETLTLLADEHLGGILGITAVLHTWTRDLSFHPHIHALVTGGALHHDGTRWLPRLGFLFPVERMKAVFRGRVLAALHPLRSALHLGDAAWRQLLRSLPPKDKWVVYTEPPFGRSSHVLAYLGRYTHRIGISDARLIEANDDVVRFATRDGKTATLTPLEFVSRFLQHVLPSGFHKIRHFGLYAPGTAHKQLAAARALLEPDSTGPTHPEGSVESGETWDALLSRLTGRDVLRCPRCQHGRLDRYPLPDPAFSETRPYRNDRPAWPP